MQTHHWPAQQRVHAGIGALDKALPRELDAFGWQRPLLITTNSLIRSGMADRVRALLGERCAGMIADIPAHSPVESVARLVAAFREGRADGVVALGGGSVIDATKGLLVALGAGLTAQAITGESLVKASGGGTSSGLAQKARQRSGVAWICPASSRSQRWWPEATQKSPGRRPAGVLMRRARRRGW